MGGLNTYRVGGTPLGATVFDRAGDITTGARADGTRLRKRGMDGDVDLSAGSPAAPWSATGGLDGIIRTPRFPAQIGVQTAPRTANAGPAADTELGQVTYRNGYVRNRTLGHPRQQAPWPTPLHISQAAGGQLLDFPSLLEPRRRKENDAGFWTMLSRDPADRPTYRNGYRNRTWDTRVGTMALQAGGQLLPQPPPAARRLWVAYVTWVDQGPGLRWHLQQPGVAHLRATG